MTIGPEVSIALLMAIRQEALPAEHIFAPVVTPEDIRLIGLTADIAEALAAGRLDGTAVRNILVAVPRPRQVQAPDFLAYGAAGGDAFGIALGLCFVPVETVDCFLARALAAERGTGLPTASDLVVDVAREAARRATARALFAELGDRAVQSRTTQFSRSLRAILSRPETLRDILVRILAGDWKEAASHFGEPSLADAVVLSLVPTCEMLMIGRRLLWRDVQP